MDVQRLTSAVSYVRDLQRSGTSDAKDPDGPPNRPESPPSQPERRYS